MGSTLLSRVIGFAREWVLARCVGATGLSDVYYASFTIPDFLNYLMAAGALSIAFIPVLSPYLERGEDEKAKEIYQTISTLMISIMIALVALGEIFAGELSQWIAPGFDPKKQALLTQLVRIILPAQIFFYWGGLAMSVQQTHGWFLYSALAPLIYNGGIILFGVLLYQQLSILAFSLGVVFGCFFSHGVTQALGLYKLGYTPSFGFHWNDDVRASLKRYLILSLPIMLGFSLVVTDEWISKYYASQLTERAVSYLSYARTQLRIPIAVIGQAAGIASFPYLARLWARGDKTLYVRTLWSETQKVFFFGIAATILIVFHSESLTYAIYGGSKFMLEDYAATALALRYMGVGLLFWVLQLLLSRALYAQGRTWFPSLIGTTLSLLFIPVYKFLAQRMGLVGLAFAGTLGILSYSVIIGTALALRLRHEFLPLKNEFLNAVGMISLFATATLIVSYFVRNLHIFQKDQKTAFLEWLVLGGILAPIIGWGYQRFLRG